MSYLYLSRKGPGYSYLCTVGSSDRETISTMDSQENYGHEIGPKNKDCCRIGFQNVNGFPATNYGEKNQATHGFLYTNEFDAFGAAELNRHWKNIPPDHRLQTRVSRWFPSAHTSVAYNTTESPKSDWQVGGVCVWSLNQMAHRVCGQGSDASGLGRWTWVRYRGKNQTSLRFVTAYRASKVSKGSSTVYAQQRNTLLKRDDSRCPRQAFVEDIGKEVKKWQEQGDAIIIALDANDDIVDSSLTKAFSKLQLVEAVINRHQGSPPATHNRGSKPIDGIFTSKGIDIQACGYLPFGEGIPSDHRAVWIDFTYASTLGHALPPFARAKARRLQCTDPRVMNAFLDRWEQFCKDHKLLEKAIDLENRATSPLTKDMIEEYEWLDKMRSDGIRAAEKSVESCTWVRLPGFQNSKYFLKK